MILRLAFFGFDQQTGCTTNALMTARHLAGGGYSVAFVEPSTSRHLNMSDYAPFKMVDGKPSSEKENPYEKDGVKVFCAWDKSIDEDFDFIIYDFGLASTEQVIGTCPPPSKYLICTNGGEDALLTLLSHFSNEALQDIKPYVLLKSGTIDDRSAIASMCSRVANISYCENMLHSELYDIITTYCGAKGIDSPPRQYDLKPWQVVQEEKKESGKKNLFGLKKKKDLSEGENTPDTKNEQSQARIEKQPEEIVYFDEEGLPIPMSDQEEGSGVRVHQGDSYSIVRPPKEFNSEEEYEEWLMTAGGASLTPGAQNKDGGSGKKDKVSGNGSTLDAAKDAAAATAGAVVKAGTWIAEKAAEIINQKKEQPTGKDMEPESETEAENKKKGFNLPNILVPKSVSENTSSVMIPIMDDDEDLPEEVEERPKKKEKPEKAPPLRFTGHLTIFVTSLKHGAGTSQVAGSIGASLAGIGNKVCFLHADGTAYPDLPSICEYTGKDFDRAYSLGKTIVIDRGCIGEMSKPEMALSSRADLKIIVSGSSESDFQQLARFIHKAGSTANDWLYVFTHSSRHQADIKDLMREYDYYLLPAHDYDCVPRSVASQWKKFLRQKSK